MWAAESVLEVSMGENVFGEEFSEHVHAEHLNEVLKHEWLSASVINIYARSLYYHKCSLLYICLGGNIN
jgi:hypothetical protein